MLVAAGVGLDTIKDWSVDPQVLIGGTKGSLFDSVEDMDTAACIEKLAGISLENGAPSGGGAAAALAREDEGPGSGLLPGRNEGCRG